jgi:hypothetical protein
VYAYGAVPSFNARLDERVASQQYIDKIVAVLLRAFNRRILRAVYISKGLRRRRRINTVTVT